jgi:hypothetical protein
MFWKRSLAVLSLVLASAGAAFGQMPPGGIPPTAVNDSVYTPHNMSIVISPLTNDSPGSSAIDPASITITQNAFGGDLQVNANGTITYTPHPRYGGVDHFDYKVRNQQGLLSNAATVTVQVQTNVAPEIVDFECEAGEAGAWLFSGRVIDEDCPNLTITFGGLLEGSSCPINEDGTFLFAKYIANPHGIVSASTVDPYGLVSNTVQEDIGL